MNRRKWTQHEIEYLKNNFSNKTNKELAQYLGRSDKSIANQGFSLGLKKDLSHISETSKRTYNPNNKGLFKKGLTPWNKDKKGYMGANKTSFKKGHIPHNTQPIGSVRIGEDGIEIKTQNPNTWEYLHRVLYSNFIGELNSIDVVRFKDGNNMNLSLQNLEKVDRGNHLRLNAGKEAIDPSISKLTLAINKLHKHVKQYEK